MILHFTFCLIMVLLIYWSQSPLFLAQKWTKGTVIICLIHIILTCFSKILPCRWLTKLILVKINQFLQLGIIMIPHLLTFSLINHLKPLLLWLVSFVPNSIEIIFLVLLVRADLRWKCLEFHGFIGLSLYLFYH